MDFTQPSNVLSMKGDDGGVVYIYGRQIVKGIKDFVNGIKTPSVTASVANLLLQTQGVGQLDLLSGANLNLTATNSVQIGANGTTGNIDIRATGGGTTFLSSDLSTTTIEAQNQLALFSNAGDIFAAAQGALSAYGTTGDVLIKASATDVNIEAANNINITATTGYTKVKSVNSSAILESTNADVQIGANTNVTSIALNTSSIQSLYRNNVESALAAVNLQAPFLTNNGVTFNPRREYNFDFTATASAGISCYPVEIIRRVDDPNITTSDATNSVTYIEIVTSNLAAAAYNNTTFNGYFRGAGYTDMTNLVDINYVLYDINECRIGAIYTGGGTGSYTNFVIYLLGGFKYRIITDGTLGNYWNGSSTTPLWALTSNITYTPTGVGGTAPTFGIRNALIGAAALTGATANVSVLVSTNFFLANSANWYKQTTTKENRYRLTSQKLMCQEQYLGTPSSSLIVPVTSFTKKCIRVGSTGSLGQLNWLVDDNVNNICYAAQLPFNCRVMAVSIDFDYDTPLPTLDLRFQLTIGNALGVSTTYLDTTGNLLIFGASTPKTIVAAVGGSIAAEIYGGSVILRNSLFYAYYAVKNASTLAAVVLENDFNVTLYMQQVVS